MREAYTEIFHLTEKPTEAERAAIKGKFKSTHNVSDQIANLQTATFYSLLKLSDLQAAKPTAGVLDTTKKVEEGPRHTPPQPICPPLRSVFDTTLKYNLPATKDIDVYNAIFKSLKEHLID